RRRESNRVPRGAIDRAGDTLKQLRRRSGRDRALVAALENHRSSDGEREPDSGSAFLGVGVPRGRRSSGSAVLGVSAPPSDTIRWRAQRSRRTYELVSLHPGNPTRSTRRRTPRVISVGRRIATTCRVHQVPTSGRAVRAATVAVAGVAWAPTRGIAK